MGLEILFRDSVKSDRYRSSHKFNLLSKVCEQFIFRVMPNLRVVFSVGEAKVDFGIKWTDEESGSELQLDFDSDSELNDSSSEESISDSESS